MKLKKLLKMLLVFGACTIPCASSLASSTNVLWDLQAVNGLERYDAKDTLVDNEVLIAVGKMLDKKLKQLEQQGRLPFKTVVISDYKNNTWQSKLEAGEQLALVPVITSEVNTRRSVVYKGVRYYAYDVMAELNIMFCNFDGKNLKIAYNIPLQNQAIIGGSLEDALTEPLTGADLKTQYIYNLEQLIDDLQFDYAMEKLISAPGDFPTYQITDVRVSPSIVANYGANKMSPGRVEYVAKPVLASTVTNNYAMKFKDRVVLPSKLSGLSWRKEVVKHISSSDISAGDYNPENEASGDVELVIDFKDFNFKTYFKNEYSIMQEVDFTTLLELVEKNGTIEKPLASTVSYKNYRLPKDLESVVEINYLDIFSSAGESLSNAIPIKRKK